MEGNGVYLGFSRREDWIGKLIRYWTGGTCDHAFFLFQKEGGWFTIGAEMVGVVTEPLGAFLAKGRKLVHVFLPVGWQIGLSVEALPYEGYDYAGLLGMLVVEVEEKLRWKRPWNPFSQKWREFCSRLTVEVMEREMGKQGKLEKWPLLLQAPNTIDPYREMLACFQAKELFQECLQELNLPGAS